ncbi:hydroxymethylglutaryl-CoA lyase [Exilibacterium tricleocarpae]|uniref:Hydroxymethylglutaryl-CoA lyase n=1 Tax=Exilibacterium tricleocarpae TaxID=2591008 RepID=A0A545TZQ7_9GAMM|nr:hydroxymethylglutaryl-CoA lyase [Exilibacterium tricleocarpae]TQV82673.1 hydroxymethylglutaryl-CoA lyase [Exilibacterium tricleocarpae]
MNAAKREQIVVTDVGPRDGLQSQEKILTPEQRLALIDALLLAGVRHLEVGSFVSPKAVPAMANTDAVVAGLPPQAAHYTALVPNFKGYELARAAGLRSVTMVVYASDAMSQVNVGKDWLTIEAVTEEMLQQAAGDGIEVIVTVAVAFGCPFAGNTEPAVVERIVEKFLARGAAQLVLADTIGAANPAQVNTLARALVSAQGAAQLGCHFHDTRALGLANVYAAVEAGVRRFDAAIGRLGGCPFAPGAAGNVATEDVVMLLEQLGFDTGIDMAGLLQAAQLANTLTGAAPGGRASAWLQKSVDKTAQTASQRQSQQPLQKDAGDRMPA